VARQDLPRRYDTRTMTSRRALYAISLWAGLVLLMLAGVAVMPSRQSISVVVPKGSAAREAWLALEEARYKDAESAFSRALAATPDDPALLVGAAIVARRLGQTARARDVLARALQIDPALAPASQLLGTLLYESGDVEGAIRVYEAALVRAPGHEAMQARVEGWRKELALHSGFLTATGGHFAVLFEGPAEQEVAGAAIDILEQAYTRIGDYLQTFPADTLTVVLYTDQQFRDITRTPEWSGGVFDGRIRLPVRGGLGDRKELERVLTHEYVHALVYGLGAIRMPVWLNEGLATALEPGGLQRAKEELSNARSLIPLAELRTSFAALPADRVQLAYAESAVAAQDILDQVGPAHVVGLFRDLASGSDLDVAFPAWVQSSIADFERDWMARARTSGREP
jgi:tetratricopeptide (TPR) repeat protein